jgi:hypothetical protein
MKDTSQQVVTIEKVIEELYTCSSACDNCHRACMEEPNKDELIRCMMLDKECLEICRLTGSLLDENSENGEKFLNLCIEICHSCAEECRKHSHEHCRLCAEACERCAQVCSDYLHHAETM